jgi:nucleoside-diphosphate-sugar epimerase
MNILLTGADGFIGSQMLEALLKNTSFKVHTTSFYNSFGNKGWINKELLNNKRILNHSIDLRDSSYVYDMIIKNKFKYIINMAALISVPYSYVSPDIFFRNNLELTQNILNAAKISKSAIKILLFSSSEVYGSAIYLPIDEKHPLQPQSPYSASKISTDSLGLSYFYTYGLPITILRPFNCYGPRQSLRAIVPTIICQYLNKNIKNIKLGNLKTSRDLTHVDDLVSIIIKLINTKKNLKGKIINIGSGKSHKINEIVNKVSKIVKIKKKIMTINSRLRPNLSEVKNLMCNNSLLKKIIGKYKFLELDEGLTTTINWYKSQPNFINNSENYEI